MFPKAKGEGQKMRPKYLKWHICEVWRLSIGKRIVIKLMRCYMLWRSLKKVKNLLNFLVFLFLTYISGK